MAQDSSDSRLVWGLPHLELSNGGRVQHGVTMVGKNLLRGLPQLQAHGAQASGESVDNRGQADELEERGEFYPQRWRVAGGEDKYEETSALRFLDGWAETYPAVVDASSGSLFCCVCSHQPKSTSAVSIVTCCMYCQR